MKYIKTFENANTLGHPLVQYSSKNDKLTEIQNKINAILPTICDKQIGFSYGKTNKGIFFTNSNGDLVDDKGYGCVTFEELCSNMEAILYSLQQLKSTNIVNYPEPPVAEVTTEITINK